MKKTITLTRTSNNHCWLLGKIEIGDQYICDSLEFGSKTCLKAGFYSLATRVDKETNTKIIVITDDFGMELSKFVMHNLTLHRNHWIRQENNLITVGTWSKEYQMKCSEYAQKLLLNEVHASEWIHEPIELEIINSEEVQNMLYNIKKNDTE